MSRVLLWDFDGTLAHRETGWSGTICQILAEHEPQLAVAATDIRSLMRHWYPWHTPQEPHPHLSDPDRWWGALEPHFAEVMVTVGVAPSRARELAPLVRPAYVNLEPWGLYAETLPTLRTLTEGGWEHIIVSNHVPELPDIVAHLGLDSYVKAVVNSATVGYEKPHPRIYREALAIAGPVEAIWMIGDNFEADVRGAEAVGIPAILVRREHPEAEMACKALPEIVALVEG